VPAQATAALRLFTLTEQLVPHGGGLRLRLGMDRVLSRCRTLIPIEFTHGGRLRAWCPVSERVPESPERGWKSPNGAILFTPSELLRGRDPLPPRPAPAATRSRRDPRAVPRHPR